MQVKAQAKFLRMSPQKVRLVLGLVRGLPILAAKQQLMFSKKDAARAVLKILESAVANARHNAGMDTAALYVTQAFADEGPKIHRFMPRARGSASPIRHRMTHATLWVGSKEEVGQIKPTQERFARLAAKKTAAAGDTVKKKTPVKKVAAKKTSTRSKKNA